jgi:hypothetical protein
MTSTFDPAEVRVLERLLAKKELDFETERTRLESVLAECAETKIQPAKDYWHRFQKLQRQVNTLRSLLEP